MATRGFTFFKRRGSLRLTAQSLVVLAAAALILFPLPANWIEAYYSNGIYPLLQSWATPFTNLLPFALSDLLLAALLIGLPAWWIARIKSAGRGRRWRAAGLLLFHTLVLTALTFLIFQLLWGLNYLRQPLTLKLEYDNQRLTTAALDQLRGMTIEQLNAESAEAHSGSWPMGEELRGMLTESFDTVVGELGNSRSIAPAHPKSSLLNIYLRATGIEGVTNPFGHEVILNSELLPFEKPFVLAHEWGHLAGFADESEANFAALLACVRSDSAAARYSGWLSLYQYLPRQRGEQNADEAGQAKPLPQLAPEVINDLRAIRERVSRGISEDMSRMQAKVYDRFLKANRVQAGIGSYGLLVRLMLGTRFESGWVPARRKE